MIPGFEETLNKMLQTARAKNADYAGEEDPFKNFRLCEEFGITSVEKGILVRVTDKLARITHLLDQEAQVKDESIEDTLEDLANYAIILKCYLENEKRNGFCVGRSPMVYEDLIDPRD